MNHLNKLDEQLTVMFEITKKKNNVFVTLKKVESQVNDPYKKNLSCFKTENEIDLPISLDSVYRVSTEVTS